MLLRIVGAVFPIVFLFNILLHPVAGQTPLYGQIVSLFRCHLCLPKNMIVSVTVELRSYKNLKESDNTGTK